MDLQEYRNLVVKDFNFNRAIDRFSSLEKFTQGLGRTYPDKAEQLGQATFEALAGEIYSYAKQGRGTQGKTNISEMQAVLYALDPYIRDSSDTNTTMKASSPPTMDAYQQLPKADRSKYVQVGEHCLPLGDGKHGRATTLTTRHIMAELDLLEPTSIPIDQNKLDGSQNTMLLIDISSSMDSGRQQFSKLLAAGGLSGQIQIGTFHDRQGSLRMLQHGRQLAAEEAAESLASGRDAVFQMPHGSRMRESGIDAGISALAQISVPEAPPRQPFKSQMVLFTDETDTQPERLAELQEMAQSRGYDVKTIICLEERGEARSFCIVNVSEIDASTIRRFISSNHHNKMPAIHWERVAESQGAPVQKWSSIQR